MEEAKVFGTDWIRTLGVIPNEYLYYYYFHRDAVRKINDLRRDPRRLPGSIPRPSSSTRRQAAGDGAAELWRETVDARSASYMAEAKGGVQGAPATHRERESDPAHQGYAGVALGVMAAITRNERTTMILNVRNRRHPRGAAGRRGGRGADHGRRQRGAPADHRPTRSWTSSD